MDKAQELLTNLLESSKFDLTPATIILVGLVLVTAKLGVWSIQKILKRSILSRRIPLESGRKEAVFQIIKYGIYSVGILVILNLLVKDISLLVASSAALFVGIGLAMQHVFDDVLSGIIILVDGTIEVGDVIEVHTLKITGKVKEIRLRTSLVETPDSTIVIVPNSRITTLNVINWDHNDQETRFRVQVSVAYGSDVSRVRKALMNCALAHGKVLKKPEPKVFFIAFAESSLQFQMLFWSKNKFEIEEVKSDLRFMVDAEFRRLGITIPFPQRDIHIISDRANQAKTESPIATDKRN